MLEQADLGIEFDMLSGKFLSLTEFYELLLQDKTR